MTVSKSDIRKTVRQWGLLGKIPKDNAKPCYVWTDWYGNPKTFYYTDTDVRDMTAEERELFDGRIVRGKKKTDR